MRIYSCPYAGRCNKVDLTFQLAMLSSDLNLIVACSYVLEISHSNFSLVLVSILWASEALKKGKFSKLTLFIFVL